MVGIGPLLLIAVIVAIVLAVRSSRGGSQPRPTEVRHRTGTAGPAPGLADELARWVAADLLSEEQSAAILAHEQTARAAPAPVPTPSAAGRPRGGPAVAEALGYLGGMLATSGLVLLVARYWSDMPTAGRLALSGAGAVGLLVAGAFVREEAAPALARLRGFLWLGSTVATALFARVLAVDGFGVDAAATVVLACAGAVALESGLLWRRRERPLQQITCLGGVVAFAGALVAAFAAGGPVGITVWILGAGYLVLGVRRLLPLPTLTDGAGAVTVIVGATITATNWQGFGLVFLVATAFGLLALATVPGLAPARADQLTIGILGGIALLEAVPSTLGYFTGQGAGVTGLVTWGMGGILVLVGARHLVRLPIIAELLGGAALIGGAAITWVQWHGFAPVFGIATAVGLVALGMLPGQVLLSVLGSLGLLINVPWAIGWFFPGEGRAPLLILVSGALILVIAVLLSRSGGRFRHDLEGLRHRKPPTGIAPGTG